MLELFESWDTKDWYMWEWGSGGSTPWFGERVDKLWSMEHSPSWFNKVKQSCEGMENVNLTCKSLDDNYVQEISQFPDTYFDCVLVDGRKRVECVKAAARKTKRYLILDNALRKQYSSARQYMESQYVWTPKVVKWEEPINGEIKKSWHAMVWERNL